MGAMNHLTRDQIVVNVTRGIHTTNLWVFFHGGDLLLMGFFSEIQQLLRLQTIKAIVNSHRFKGSSSDEPRRVQVLDLYCLTRFESEGSRRGDVY